MKTYALLPAGTPATERANFYTHFAGFWLSLIGLPFLVLRAGDSGYTTTGFWIFGLSAAILYLSSSLYHGIQQPHWKFRLRKLDHIAIYFLIAGTHTPFVQQYLQAPWSYWYLPVLWGLVALGTGYKLFFFGRWPIFSTIYYLILGWLAILVVPLMYNYMPAGCFRWILIGGLSYSAGVFFYSREKGKYNHAIWHLFVLGGTAAHYRALWLTAG